MKFTSPIDAVKRQLTLSTHRIHTLPVVVLMPHSRCNCRCVMCDIWRGNRNKQELTEDDLAPHLATFRRLGVRWVVLSGGEALMHSNLWRLCEQLADLGVKITLLSTGLLLRRWAQDIVRWCDEVIVSLDGSKDVHDSIRRIPNAFDQLADGVAALREAKPGFRVTARCVLQRENFRDLGNIVDAARNIGLDQLSFLAADISSEAFNRPGGWDEERADEVALGRQEAREFAELVERLIVEKGEVFASGFIAESPTRMRDLARLFRAHHGDAEYPEVVCNAPWVSTVIEADGTVRPCFFHDALGNIREQPLAEILDSPTAVDFRRSLDMGRDPTCRKCVCTLHLRPYEAL